MRRTREEPVRHFETEQDLAVRLRRLQVIDLQAQAERIEAQIADPGFQTEAIVQGLRERPLEQPGRQAEAGSTVENDDDCCD